MNQLPHHPPEPQVRCPTRSFALPLALAAWWALASGTTTAAPLRVYSHILAPREHLDYKRRAVQPPDWSTFKNRTQFSCLRGFGMKDGQLVGFAEELEKYTRTHELGGVITGC